MIKSSSPSSSSRRRHSSHKSSEREKDASANRPRPHLHGDHHHVRDPHCHEGQVTSKHHVHDDDERHLLRAQARQRHHHHEDAPQAQMHKSHKALLHAKSKLQEHKRRPRDDHHQDGATATSTTLASSPSAIKASSPLDIRYLRLLPTSTLTMTSSSPRRQPTSEGDSSIFGSPPRKMAEHGKFPSVMETSYEVPHHMGLQQ